ncbi:endospore germination permease [Lederbergia wuyishanensis]|uniref:Spore germination protein n=1 Tax=Lederbergia wuyishanensis TaxID=1347903 RepID=A0ABU0D908_9BACI|nr:endospore germination permease [Lederbergia wuyishanensis]MCJ8007556.1 spore germination protein [Lederbergia wuyishanensis]MDQ0344863.1 spore germination protein [Lederbergia wuyishanensis]
MGQSRDITAVQTATILISTIIGVGVLNLPLIAVQAGGTGAPLLTLIAVLIGFIGLYSITKLGLRFPNQSIVGYSQIVLGKWIGRFYGLTIILFFTFLTAMASREFGEVVVAAVLKNTPIEVTVIVMLLMSAVFTRDDINTFTYIHNFYVPAILIPALIIVVLSFKNANPLYFQPIFYPLISNSLNHVFVGMLTVAALFQGFFIITIIIPYMQKPGKAMKSAIWGIGISGILYIMIVLAALSVFGVDEMKNLMWPTLELARATSLPGNLLQRLDVVFLAVWVTAVFTTIFSSYMLTVHSLSQFFRLQGHKTFSMFLLPIVFFIAMIPRNVFQMYDVIKIVGRIGLLLTILIPILILFTAIIRKLPEKKGGS